MGKSGWPKRSQCRGGHPPKRLFIVRDRTFGLLLVWLSCLAFFFPVTLRASQSGASHDSGVPKCAQQKQFDTLLAKGSNAKVSVADRQTALEGAVKLCPKDPAAYESLTALSLQQQDFQQALTWDHRGLKVAPRNFNLILALGTVLLSGGRPQDALAVFKNLPPNAQTEFYLGMTYRALRNHKAAREALSKSYAMGYHDPYVLYVLIEQDHDLRDTKAGLKDFRTLYQRFPRSPWLHLLLGNAYEAQHNITDAEAEYKKAAKLDPNLPIVHFSLGLIEFDRSDYKAAIQDFSQETKVDPAFGRAYLYIGATLRRMGKNREAIPYLEKAIARDPNFGLAYSTLASAQIQAGQKEKALKTLEEGEKRFPKEAAFPAQLSQLMRTMGDVRSAQKQATLAELLSQKDNPVTRGVATPKVVTKKKASLDSHSLEKLRQCLKKGNVQCASQALGKLNDAALENNPEYLNLKAQTLNMEKKRKEALAAIKRAIAADPNQADYWMTQGKIYQWLGNEVAAIKSFLRAGQMEKNPAEAIYYIGMSFFLLGNYYNQDKYYLRAAQHFKTALQLDPHFDKAVFMLGAVNSIEFKLDQAKLDFQKAMQMSPNNPYYILHYGILLNRMGDTTAALREMERAEQIDPSYARTYFNMGSVEAQVGKYKEARAQLEKGIQMDPKNAQAYYTLGRVYYQLGQKTKSREALLKFQQLKEKKEQEVDPLGIPTPSAPPHAPSQR